MTPRTAAGAGALAAAAALAASEGVAAALDLRESPVLAVGQSVVELTPGPIAEVIIGLVGHADKPLAVASVVVGILLLGAVAGRGWSTHRLRSVGLAVVLTGVAVTAVLTRPYASAGGVVAAVVGGVVLLGVLDLLHRTSPSGGSSTDEPPTDAERRRFLRTVAAVGALTVLVGGAGQVLASRHRRRAELERIRAALRITRRTAGAPNGVDLGIDAQQPWLTPNDAFYRIDTTLSPPLIDPAEWRLRIHGMVDREITLTYADLVDRGLDDAWITLCCVSNPIGGDLIGNTVWSGVPMRDLLEEAGVQEGADALLSTSDDGWTCGTPLSALTDGRAAMLAVLMNGEPLPIPHGFPVRQVVPGLYGYVSATKWVVDWEVTRFADFEAYWTQRGWGERGPVKTGSRIDVPRSGATVERGTTTVAGVAWRQHVGIRGVQVRVDGGPWQDATLAKVPNDDTWVQWRADVELSESGSHRVECRALDGEGTPQTGERADVLPDGATGYDGISLAVT